MMTPDDLRSLADALEPMAKAPRFEDFNVPEFCAWLRACADAQPVAVPAGWKLVPVEPTPEMLSAVGMMDSYDWHAPGCSPDADHANWYSAMIEAAPAAPQAEPKREPVSDSRPCTCHPDDNPPVPCARKYALSECRAASGEPTEAQIEEYEILCNGEWAASASGEGAEAEILHYLTQYEEDGPCEVYAVSRRLVDRAALAAKDKENNDADQ